MRRTWGRKTPARLHNTMPGARSQGDLLSSLASARATRRLFLRVHTVRGRPVMREMRSLSAGSGRPLAGHNRCAASRRGHRSLWSAKTHTMPPNPTTFVAGGGCGSGCAFASSPNGDCAFDHSRMSRASGAVAQTRRQRRRDRHGAEVPLKSEAPDPITTKTRYLNVAASW